MAKEKNKSPLPFYITSKWGNPIFKRLQINGVTYKKWFNEHLVDSEGELITNKMLIETIKKMLKRGIIEVAPSIGADPAYDLTPRYRTKHFDQIIYFNMIQKKEFFSDIMSFQHSVYGLPEFDEMTEYEQRIALGLLRQIDDTLNGMKKLKTLHEIGEKQEQPVVSVKLALQLLVTRFAEALYQLLENEPDDSKNYQLIVKLVNETSKLGKEMQFEICDESSPYPEKLFHYTFSPDYQFMSNLDNGLVCLLKESKEDIALLSTPLLNRAKIVGENIELKLNACIQDSLYVKHKFQERLADGNIGRLADVIHAGVACQGGYWVKKSALEDKFMYHKQLNRYFSEEEIKFMLNTIKAIVNELKDFIIEKIEMKQFIIYKGFSEGGLWHDENKSDFYKIAYDVVASIKGEELCNLNRNERIEKIKKKVMNGKTLYGKTLYGKTLYDSKKDTHGEYGFNELLLYIEASSYFKKVRPLKIKEAYPGNYWEGDISEVEW